MMTSLCCALLLAAGQAQRPLEIVVLAPSSETANAKALLTIGSLEGLLLEAGRRRFDVLTEKAPFLVLHRAFLDDSRSQVALDLLSLLKGFDPTKPIRLDDLPDGVRSRIEPTMRRMLTMASGAAPKDRIQFAVVPTLSIGVKEKAYDGRLAPPASLASISAAYRRPALHPDADGYVHDLGPSTLPNPSAIPVAARDPLDLDDSTMLYSWTVNDRSRAETAQAIWKALAERLAAMRARYEKLLSQEATRVLEPTGALQGFQNEVASFADLAPMVQRYVAHTREWARLQDGTQVPTLYLRGFGLEFQVESSPGKVLSMSLDYLLAAERKGGR